MADVVADRSHSGKHRRMSAIRLSRRATSSRRVTAAVRTVAVTSSSMADIEGVAVEAEAVVPVGCRAAGRKRVRCHL